MLRQVPIELIRPGFRLPGALRAQSGAVILPGGVSLTDAQILHLGLRSPRRLYGEDDWPVDLLRFPVSEPAPHSTAAAMEPASQRKTPARSNASLTRRLDRLLSKELNRLPWVRPVDASDRPKLPRPEFEEEAIRGVDRCSAMAEALAEVFDGVRARRLASCHRLRELADEFASLLAVDFDLLPTVASARRARHGYLIDHSVNAALLSMAIAGQLGLDRRRVTEIGLGSMLKDIGMLRIPKPIRLARRSLTPDEKALVERHPVHTVNALGRLRELPTTALLIGHQSHERPDRSGYPCRRSGAFIHPYARIASIADAYTAMTHPRPYRDAVLPHEAVKRILIEGGLGKYDLNMLRAFLDSVSLFPIGSWVELNDGTTAKVVRANPGSHTRPVVAAYDAAGRPTGELVDLTMEVCRRILRCTLPVRPSCDDTPVTSGPTKPHSAP